jgi:hypothetical protein
MAPLETLSLNYLQSFYAKPVGILRRFKGKSEGTISTAIVISVL